MAFRQEFSYRQICDAYLAHWKPYSKSQYEICGPCPICKTGVDRFHIRQGDSTVLLGCRKCPQATVKEFLEALNLYDASGQPNRSERFDSALPPVAPKVVRTPFRPPKGCQRWKYKTADGEHVLTTFRWQDDSGRRVIRQATPDGKGGYETGNMPQMRPLLYAERIALLPATEPILVVEGEKCVTAANDAGVKATTWPSGAGAWDKADWSVLKGRTVRLWPDHDDPGYDAMHGVAEKLLAIDCTVQWIKPPPAAEPKWDCADTEAAQIVHMVKEAEPYAQHKPEQPAHQKAAPVQLDTTPPPDQSAELVELLDVRHATAKPIRWLWHEYIPEGEITVLAGKGGAGKSTLALTFAAIVASGSAWPDGKTARRGGVVIMSTEDDPEKVQVPRTQTALRARKVDPKEAETIQTVQFSKHASIASVLLPLLQQLEDSGDPPALLIIDPLIEIMSRGNSNAANDVRECLHPIQTFAARTRTAVLGVTHLAKYSNEADAVERVLGSSAWTAKPRALLLAHYSQKDSDQRKLVRAKSNLGPDGGGYEYDLVINAQSISTAVFGNELIGDADQLTEPQKGLSKTDIETGDKAVAELRKLFGPDSQKPDWAMFPSASFNSMTRWSTRKAKQYRDLNGYETRQASHPHKGGWFWVEGSECSE